jgi:hypothetical protein
MMWHPVSEAEACSDMAAFIEWLRATRGMQTLDPAALHAWREAEPAQYTAAFAEFEAL